MPCKALYQLHLVNIRIRFKCASMYLIIVYVACRFVQSVGHCLEVNGDRRNFLCIRLYAMSSRKVSVNKQFGTAELVITFEEFLGHLALMTLSFIYSLLHISWETLDLHDGRLTT